MTRRNHDGVAPRLSPELLKQIEQSLRPINKDEVTIYRKNERPPILSLSSPARGRFSAHAIRLIGDCAKLWGQESRHPQALQAHDSDVPGFILFEPVVRYDATAPNQYPISWTDGFHRAYIELRPILQPRNLETPPGYISEMAVSLEALPSGTHYLFLHTGGAKTRPEGDLTPEEEQDFTASDEDLAGEEPADSAAASVDP